jgi:hypothetical protein
MKGSVMPAVEVTITGMLYDKLARTSQNVVLIGEATLTGLGVGGGPIVPPPVTPPTEPPLSIWGPGDPRPTLPISGWDPGSGNFPTPPITPVPPDVTIPPPGSPPSVLPGSTPTHPITPPPAIVVNYPGIGKVLVPMPLPPPA